jgi:hypothetical protein
MNNADTNFLKKVSVLASLYSDYYDNESLYDFIDKNNVGLPLAFCYSESFVEELSERGIAYIENTYDALIKLFALPDDDSYMDIDDVLDRAGRKV